MIALFLLKTNADAFSQKCHDWLINNCPNYTADKWMIPRKHPLRNIYAVKIPQEYFDNLYQEKSESIQTALQTFQSKISERFERFPDDWNT